MSPRAESLKVPRTFSVRASSACEATGCSHTWEETTKNRRGETVRMTGKGAQEGTVWENRERTSDMEHVTGTGEIPGEAARREHCR